MATTQKASESIKRLVLLAMFSAIIILLAVTPIGFINLAFIKATIVHIPVIIGSLLLGPKLGAVLGFVFGVTSLINNTLNPAISSFVFSPFIPVPGRSTGSPWALVICFVPRILVGVVPWYIYRLAKKWVKEERLNFIPLALAGIVGSATNTLLVMHLIYFLFRDEYAAIRGVAQKAVYGIISAIIVGHGVPEAVLACILTTAITKALLIVLHKDSADGAP
ncbi:MAG: ECF transporter S component [Firmicutes bacterium]|nr:ECF transporter S component [Bacillota bacterium]